MRGVVVDGNDPDATVAVLTEAVAAARAGSGPTLVEARTYRFMGHFYGDPMTYMDPDELARATAADPVPAYRARLIAEQIATDDELGAVEEAVDTLIDDAFAAAIAAAPPAPGVVADHVYAGGRA
jgi:pyruvate dehydrogenase E1 component alpha subunit